MASPMLWGKVERPRGHDALLALQNQEPFRPPGTSVPQPLPQENGAGGEGGWGGAGAGGVGGREWMGLIQFGRWGSAVTTGHVINGVYTSPLPPWAQQSTGWGFSAELPLHIRSPGGREGGVDWALVSFPRGAWPGPLPASWG